MECGVIGCPSTHYESGSTCTSLCPAGQYYLYYEPLYCYPGTSTTTPKGYFCFEGIRSMNREECCANGSYWINNVCYWYKTN